MPQALTDWVTQLWVRATGRRVLLSDSPWLRGPVGDTDVIGKEFFRRWANREGVLLDAESPGRGLLPGVPLLDGASFDSRKLSLEVARFYEQTSDYSFSVKPRWQGGLWPFAWLACPVAPCLVPRIAFSLFVRLT